jgi:hypothetical protein
MMYYRYFGVGGAGRSYCFIELFLLVSCLVMSSLSGYLRCEMYYRISGVGEVG